MKVLSVDVGGSHVEILAAGQPREQARRIEPKPDPWKTTRRLLGAFLVEEVVLRGGNVRLLTELSPGCRRGGNADAFDGGFRLRHRPAA